MFQFDETLFRKMMWVMPRLNHLSARACNWSPALASALEDVLKQWPQICKLDLDDNFAIETWNTPMTVFSAEGLFRNNLGSMFQRFAEWPLKQLAIDLTNESLENFFDFVVRSQLEYLSVHVSKVQVSSQFVELSEKYVSQIHISKIVFHFSHIQKVSFTWFMNLKRIWSASRGTV